MFLLKPWSGSGRCISQYENINNSEMGDLSLTSFCQSRAEMNVIYLHFLRYREIDEQHLLVQWLWQTLEQFTNEERVLFMRFVSGRSRLPANIADISQRFQIMKVDRVCMCVCFRTECPGQSQISKAYYHWQYMYLPECNLTEFIKFLYEMTNYYLQNLNYQMCIIVDTHLIVESC